MIVPKFANWFTIDVLKDSRLELLVLQHEDPDKVKWAHEYRRNYPTDLTKDSGSALVLKTGQPALVEVITQEMIDASITNPVQREAINEVGMQSAITVALSNKGKISGLMTLISSTQGRHFDHIDLEFAQNLSNLIGLALENARLNEEAEQTAKQFQFLVESIPHKLWTSAPDGTSTYYNRQWYDYTGIEGFERLKEEIWDVIHPDDRRVAEIQWPNSIKNGLDTEIEQRFRYKDGTYRWHLTRFSPHKNDHGEIRLWLGTSTDIHEQKISAIELAELNQEAAAANEELAAINEEQSATNDELIKTKDILETTLSELAANEKRFRFLLNAIPQQVWTATPDGALNYVNEVVCKDFGFNTQEIVGQGWQKFIHPDDLPDCVEKWVAALQTGKEYLVEFRLLFADGVYRWHLTRAVPLNENGVIQLWIGTNTNIELQKQNEQRKDEFLSIASHELKTPLTSIKAFNQLLQRVKDPEKMEPFAKKTAEHIGRLERLINDLLDVTKINSGKLNYNMQPFDFGRMVFETVESARLIEETHEIILDNQANISYNGDHYRLEQVLNNFISNAIKYSPEGKKVVVSTKIESANIVVSVQDFGIGIAPENVGNLFDRYYRVDNTAMRFDGLGLGLFIASEILKRHQGNFWIDSELGKGSTFFFRLPLPEGQQNKVIQTGTHYRDNTIQIAYNKNKKRLDVDWTGYQNLESVQRGCLHMLDMMKKNKVVKIVNDNTHVLGSWSEAVEWTGNTWFPMMEEAGLRYFALIYSPSMFSQLSAKKSIDVGIGSITAQYFTEVALAEDWIDRF